MFERLKSVYPHEAVTQIFFGLMENSEFREKFISRYEYIVDNYVNTEKLLEQIELFESTYRSEVKRHIARWRYPDTMQVWQDIVNGLKNFAQKRPKIVLEQLKAL